MFKSSDVISRMRETCCFSAHNAVGRCVLMNTCDSDVSVASAAFVYEKKFLCY